MAIHQTFWIASCAFGNGCDCPLGITVGVGLDDVRQAAAPPGNERGA